MLLRFRLTRNQTRQYQVIDHFRMFQVSHGYRPPTYSNQVLALYSRNFVGLKSSLCKWPGGPLLTANTRPVRLTCKCLEKTETGHPARPINSTPPPLINTSGSPFPWTS